MYADKLNEALKVRGMTQADLARKTGISEACISQYCNGVYTPKQKRTDIIADALGFDINWFLGKEKDSPSTERLSELKLRYIELVKAMPDDLVAQLLAIAEQAARTDG